MIPLAIPNLTGREAEYLQQCITTGFVSSVGAFVTQIEAMSAEATGAQYAVSTSSGTTGLHLALVTAGVRPNDLVLLPSFTFIASANAISHAGATPWLVDIGRESWTLDVELLEELLARETTRNGEDLIHKASGRRVAACMPVYTLGMPADMDAIALVVRRYGLPLIADAAAAVGARYKGRNIAELADLSVLSFNGNKTVTAGGGGMVVGNDAGLMARARHLSTTARLGPNYDHDAVGYNYRMTNVAAAVGCAQLEQLDKFVAAKRRITARYRAGFADMQALDAFPMPDWAESACWFAGALLNRDAHPPIDVVCAELRQRGIEARQFWKPIHLQLPYRDAPHTAMPVAEAIWDRVLTLPCSTHLTDDEQDRVVAEVRAVLS